jgi:hypothetical protein
MGHHQWALEERQSSQAFIAIRLLRTIVSCSSLSVVTIMVEMLPGQLSFKDNGFDVINQIDQVH